MGATQGKASEKKERGVGRAEERRLLNNRLNFRLTLREKVSFKYDVLEIHTGQTCNLHIKT